MFETGQLKLEQAVDRVLRILVGALPSDWIWKIAHTLLPFSGTSGKMPLPLVEVAFGESK